MAQGIKRLGILAMVAVGIGACMSVSTDAQDRLSSRHADAFTGRFEASITSSVLLVHSEESDRHRAVINVELPAGLDTFHVDVAELVMTVSTVYDTTDPLILVVAPVINASIVTEITEKSDWRLQDGGMNMEYLTVTPLSSNEEHAEVRLDITPIVELWRLGVIENRGLVVRTATEGKSKFRWERTGAYGGAHAKLEIMYSGL
jgi:hypothetical protein